jgi:hypothetical protein
VYREDHLRVGVPLHQLLVEGGAGPVHGGAIVAEDLLPIGKLTPTGSLPKLHVLRVFDHLGHVVAGQTPALRARP